MDLSKVKFHESNDLNEEKETMELSFNDEKNLFDQNKLVEDEETDHSDEEEDEDENESILVMEINRLQDELSHNSYDYDKHLKLIQNLRSVGELDLLREAREKMYNIYPLSSKLWNEWISDEITIVSTKEQRLKILSLYERATADYLDINLWLDYVQFSIGLLDLIDGDCEGVRKIFEKALTHAGLHVREGSLLWEVYREFEYAMLSKCGEFDEKNRQEIMNQIKRIFSIFSRQLSIPLFQMDQTYKELEEWIETIKQNYKVDLKENQNDYHSLKSKYEKALKKLETLKNFEMSLINSESSNYQQYLKYIDHEIKNNDLARTQCLFERAITEHPLQADLWIKYLKYSDSKVVVGNFLLPIYERAIRNCCWISDLWIKYMEAVERTSDETEPDSLLNKISSIFDQSLKNVSHDNHKSLWLTYLYFYRRRLNKLEWKNIKEVEILRSLFQQAIDHLEPYFGVDYCADLYKYSAMVEVKYCKNIQKAREIWDELCKKSENYKYQAEFWVEWANFELFHCNNEKKYRKILQQGLNSATDYPENIGQLLIKFEQENGDDMAQYYESVLKYEKILKKINEKKIEKKTDKLEPKDDSRKRKIVFSDSVNKNENTSETKKKKIASPKPDGHGVTVQTDESKRDQTVFISNLDFNVEEEEIRKAFERFGNINDVRLVRNFKGLSKGFGYIEFADVMSVKKAIENDRMLISNRPVFINEMDKRNKFSYASKKEENKLFVKNIPFDYTKEMLIEKVFAEYKNFIKDVRLITYRNGHSKGWAYVDFEDAIIAKKVVDEKNGFEIGDKKLLIAISDPSLKNSNMFNDVFVSNKTNFEKNTQFVTKTTSLIPHSLRVKSQPSKIKLQIEKHSLFQQSQNEPSSSNGEKDQEIKPNLKNDQFRSLFLK